MNTINEKMSDAQGGEAIEASKLRKQGAAMLALLKQNEEEEIDWLEFKLINFNEEFELTGICRLVVNEYSEHQ